MAAPSLNPAHPSITATYRGWQLTARWFPEWAATAAGWICYARAPGVTSGRGASLAMRRATAEAALDIGRKWVDVQIDGPAPKPLRRRLAGRGKD